MKNLLIALMLVIMGQRWEFAGNVGILYCQGFPEQCFGGEPHYRLVYVIGEPMTKKECKGPFDKVGCVVELERFTIPVPNTSSKAMTKDEAEKANKELMK